MAQTQWFVRDQLNCFPRWCQISLLDPKWRSFCPNSCQPSLWTPWETTLQQACICLKVRHVAHQARGYDRCWNMKWAHVAATVFLMSRPFLRRSSVTETKFHPLNMLHEIQLVWICTPWTEGTLLLQQHIYMRTSASCLPVRLLSLQHAFCTYAQKGLSMLHVTRTRLPYKVFLDVTQFHPVILLVEITWQAY